MASEALRVLVVGSFDLFHFGHVRTFVRIRELAPRVHLVVGLVPDDIVQREKGEVILKQKERAEVVRSCKYVDDVLLDTPWLPDRAYLDANSDSGAYYANTDVAPRFRVVERTDHVSQSMIMSRVIRKYHAFLGHVSSTDGETLSRLRTSGGVAAPRPEWATSRFLGGYLTHVGEDALAAWSNIGLGREQHLTADAAPRLQALLELCQQLVPGWAALTPAHVAMDEIQGGLTNQLTRLSVRAGVALGAAAHSTQAEAPRTVLVRVYGETDMFFNRDHEHRIILAFAQQGIGPRIYGFFPGGRIEEFLHATTMTTLQLPSVLPQVGEQLARLHVCAIDLPRSPSLFRNLYAWLDIARHVRPRARDADVYAALNFAALEAEIDAMKGRLAALQSPICFCHNDLLAGNILRLADGALVFIDYEYGSYNYRGYDFGNHFCEWTIDYSVPEKYRISLDMYPSEEQQNAFFAAYLAHHRRLTGAGSAAATAEELAALRHETLCFALAAHLTWGMWAVIQGSTSQIDFPYLQYARDRFACYYTLKGSVGWD